MPGERNTAEVVDLPCLCANLRRAARLVSDLYERDAGFAGLGITPFSIAQAVSRTGATTHGALGVLLGLDQTTVSRSVATLGKKGWVRIVPGEDRRERRVLLTAKGSREFARAERSWRRAQARLQRRYGRDEWNRLTGALTAIAAAVRNGGR